MKKRFSGVLSFMVALSMALSALTNVVSYAAGEPDMQLYTFGDENGAKDEGEIFDSVNMVDWTKSRIEGDESNPMFEPYEQSYEDGKVWTLKRQYDSKNKNNAAGYVTYKSEGITSFTVSFIIGMNQGYRPENAKFYTSLDNSEFIQHTEIIKTGAEPTEDGDFQRWTYSGYNIPEGTEYLRIEFPGLPDASSDGFKTVQLEKVKINSNAEMDGYNEDVEVDLQYSDNNVATFSWPEFVSDEDFSYVIAWDGQYINTLDKSQTSFSVPVEDNTEYRFDVVAVTDTSDSSVTKTSKLIHSQIKKTDGDDGVFIDQFKFAETINNGKTWSGGTPAWNSDSKSVQRTVQTDNLEVVYEIPEGISSFEVEMLIYNPKSMPGETTFQVKGEDGNWSTVNTEKTDETGSPNWRTVPWVYRADNIPEGSTALKIIFGKVASGNNRQNTVQLHKVTIVKANVGPAFYTWDGELDTERTDTSIKLVVPAISGNPQDIKYIVTKDDEKIEVTDLPFTEYIFKDLIPGQEYSFSVQAINTEDDSKKSSKLTCSATTYAQEDLWGANKVVSEAGENNDEIIMTFPLIDGALSTVYTVIDSDGAVVATVSDGNTYTLRGLSEGNHDYRVQAVAEKADGIHYSTWLYTSVTAGEIEHWGEDAKIDIYNISKDSMDLLWTPFENMDGRSYQIRVNGSEAGVTAENSYKLTNLTPGTEYGVSIVVIENGVEISNALTAQASTSRDRDFYVDFLGSDLSHSDWQENTYYHSAEEIPYIVELNDATFSLTQHVNDPQGPNWGAFYRVKDGSSPDSYIAVDAGAPLSSLRVKTIVTGAESSIKIEYAVDDGQPQYTLGNFDSSEHEWISLEGSYNEVQVGTAGEWDDGKKVRKTDRQVYEHVIDELPPNARFFRIYFSKITSYTGTALRPWRSGTMGFGGTFSDEMTESVNAFDFTSVLADGDSMDSITKNLTLPDQVDGYPVTWKSSKPDIISSEGQFNSENIKNGYKEEGIVFTAEFRRNALDDLPEITRSWSVTAIKNTDNWTTEDFLDFDLSIYPDSASLTTPQDPNAIYTDIMLPESIEGGSDITWSVSDAEHAKLVDGKTVQIIMENDKEVTLDLIMTVTKDGISKSRSYPITIVRGYGSNIALGNASITASSNKNTAANVANKDQKFWESASDDTLPYLQYTFNEKTDLCAILLSQIGNDAEKFVISVSDDGKTFEDILSENMPADSQKEVFAFDTVNAKSVRVTFTPKSESTVKILNFEVYNEPITADQIFDEVFGAINIPKTAYSNITLPTTGYKNIPITWTSSNPRAISETGVVTRQSSAVLVTLTASVTYNGETRTKEYTVSVPKGNTSGGSGGGGGSSSSGGSSGGSGGGFPYVPNNKPSENIQDETNNESSIYSDVPLGHWAYEYIKELTEKNIVNGTGDNKFSPELNVTREAFLKMLLNGMGIEVSDTDTPFEDVDSNEWYAPYVAEAYKLGIVNGIDDKTFGIGREIKRADMAVMTYNLLKIYNLVPETVNKAEYVDSADIPDYALEAADNLTALSIMSGNENNMFVPLSSATRAEASKIVYSVEKLVTQ